MKRSPRAGGGRLRTRGKRVVAEATIPAALIDEHTHTSGQKLFHARQVSNLGGFMPGVNNNSQAC